MTAAEVGGLDGGGDGQGRVGQRVSSGGARGGQVEPDPTFNPHQRWLLSSATDTQRFFDEDLDGLGFQLKEWHWTAGREQLMADLVFGRRIADALIGQIPEAIAECL